MDKKTLGVILFFLCFLTNLIWGQEDGTDIHYTKKTERITILDNISGYRKSVELKGEFITNKTHIEQIVYSELEEISNIDPKYYNSKNKLKKIKEEKTDNSSVITSSFYSGHRAYLIDYNNTGNKFVLSYDLICKELMNLSALELNSYEKTDTFEYFIDVPINYSLLYKKTKNNDFLTIDSTITENIVSYKITNIPKNKLKIVWDITHPYETPKDLANNFLRIIILPKESAKEPWKYFNNWYLSLINKQIKLSNETLRDLENQLIKNISNRDSIPEAIFDYVKSKVAYIDIENGIGAFQPRNPNDILLKKQGDCKDMANLLFQLLKHFQFDAYITISATQSHFCDLDFPSLSSGNHVICTLKKDNEYIFLDATESECIFGLPSRHIQDKNVFIVNDSGGEILNVSIVSPEINEINTTISAVKTKTGIEADLISHYKGLSDVEIRTVYNRLNKVDYSNYISQKFHSILGSTNFNTPETKLFPKYTETKVKISTTNNIIENDGKTIIQLRFLPYPHFLPRKINDSTLFCTYIANQNTFTCKIQLEKPAKLSSFSPIKYDKDGFKFEFYVNQISVDVIEIKYLFQLKKILFSDEDIQTYSELNKLILKTLNSNISYE